MIKWIGQHIWDFTSRFRADVYFDTLSSTENNQVLLLDANEKVATSSSFLFMPDIAGSNGAETSHSGKQTLFIGEDNNLQSYITKISHSDGDGGKLYVQAGSPADGAATNAVGGSIIIKGGSSTGKGPGGDVLLSTIKPGPSNGTSLNVDSCSLTWKALSTNVDHSAYLEGPAGLGLGIKSSKNMIFHIDHDDDDTGRSFFFINNTSTVIAELDESGDLQIDGDLTVDGGDITLGGTGRIQGIDTVTDSTDAASKAYVDGAVGGGLSFDGSTANGLLTYKDADEITVESNATYDGADLTLTSATSTKPILSIENTTNDANAGELKLIGRRSADASVIAANGDDTGKITFVGENNKSGPDPETITYSQILSETAAVTDGAEMGKLSMTVAKAGSLVNLFNGYAGATGTVATFGDGGLLGSTTFDSTITEFQSTTSTGPIMSIVNGTNDATGPSLSFFNSRGGTGPGGAANANGDDLGTLKWIGYDAGAVQTVFAQMLGEANEVTAGSEEGKLTLSVASHDAEMQPGLTIVSGNVEDEVDVTIGNGATSIVTVPGNISIGGHSINDIDVAGEFVDSDEHLMTAAAINDQFGGGGGVTADPFSTTIIKVLPNQWIINDDVGRPLFVEDDTSNTLGVRCFSTTDEMYAWQKLPNGYKATHVQVHASASTSSAVSVRSYNYQTGADNTVSSTTGDLNANIDITDIPAHATTDLVIKVSPASGSTIVYGATVTIATI